MSSKHHSVLQTSGLSDTDDTLRVVTLAPSLIFCGNDYRAVWTGVKRLDALVEKRLQQDYDGIKNILCWGDCKAIDYKYDGDLIYVTLRKKSGFTKEDEDDMIDMVNENGPDTWMEGDIGIIRYEEAKKANYNNGNEVELGVDIVSINPVK